MFSGDINDTLSDSESIVSITGNDNVYEEIYLNNIMYGRIHLRGQ